MNETIADWLIWYALNRAEPYEHIPGYMNRYWLLPYGRQRYAMRAHHILRSDEDREFHDHPWNYCSLILRGCYTEVTPVYDKSGLYQGEQRVTYHAGSFLRRKATHFHRIELFPGSTVWTLFMTGRVQQKWGFMLNPANKQYWRDFLRERGRFLAGQSSEGHHNEGDQDVSER